MSILLSLNSESRWLARGRHAAKVVAERVLPASLVVFRGPQGRPNQPWKPRERAGQVPPPPTGGRPSRVALSFDDGPTPLTEPYLDVLDRLGVRATFFLVGELCAAHPELVRAIADRGHELAGHGYTHRRFTSLSRAALASELTRTSALLPAPARPGKRQLVRPPYGAVSLSSLLTCARHGFTTVLWSLNSCDWRARNAVEVERAVREGRASAGDIVLLHEGQPLTIEALPSVVGGLKESGHELVTVGELLD